MNSPLKTVFVGVILLGALTASGAWAQELKDPNEVFFTTNSNGIVLGNPRNAVDDLKRIYQILEQYKAEHQGQMPADLRTLMQELASNSKSYGLADYNAVRECLSNPDYLLTDSGISPEEARKTINYITNFGATKDARDVLAYTNLYVYDNFNYYKDGKSIPNRVGFYVVLRADGTIERLPYDLAVTKRTGNTGSLNFFETKPDELLASVTYAEEWDGFNLLGKPTPGPMRAPVADNGGPEALVQLSRRQLFPDIYGIDREKLWATFSPTEAEFSVWDVAAGAEKLGLDLSVAKQSLEQLQKNGAPALLFLQDNGHIVTLTALDDDRAVIVDKGAPENVARADLEKRYFGDALVLNKALKQNAGVVAQDNVRAIQLTTRDAEIAQQVTIRNVGTQQISLQLEPLSPGVTSAQLSAPTLAPGETVTLELKMRWRSVLRARTQNVLVSLRTDDPITPRLQVAFVLVPPA